MKYIVLSGDSHTCGEGGEGFFILDESQLGYNPMGRGLGRNTNYATRCYTNLVREAILQRTGSRAEELPFEKLAELSGLSVVNRCVHLTGPLDIPVACDGAVLLLAEKPEKAVAEIRLDGRLVKSEPLQADVTRYGDWSFRPVPVDCTGASRLTVCAAEGEVYVSSLQLFSGEWAVVAAGVGSCPAGRFRKDYFEDCVAPYTPAIVVLEAHTINDWINTETPEQYGRDLSALIARVREIGATPVLLTVSPILGPQEINGHAPYIRYVEQSLETAREKGVAVADGYSAIASQLLGLTEEEQRQQFYHDPWHVNTQGHRIYCDTIMPLLTDLL